MCKMYPCNFVQNEPQVVNSCIIFLKRIHFSMHFFIYCYLINKAVKTFKQSALIFY